MVYDLDVLFILSEREPFTKYNKYIKAHTLQGETGLILKCVETYFKEKTEASKIDWATFPSYFWPKYQKQVTPNQANVIIAMFKRLETGHKPSANAQEIVLSLVEKDYAARIIHDATAVVNGGKHLEDVLSLASTGVKDLGRFLDVQSQFATAGLSGIVTRALTDGWHWRLACLNDSLGPLRQGDFIIVGARVEVGKTTFIASEVSNFAEQMEAKGEKRPILWVNNEEQSDKVLFRLHQAALARTTKDINANPSKAEADYASALGLAGKRILVTNGNINSVEGLTSLFAEVNPCMIVFDQLDKVDGFWKIDNEAMRLGKIYKWARELAREYGPVITASQLSFEAAHTDPKSLGLDLLRQSKTDKPGEADVVILIAPEDHNVASDTRFLNIAKNKLMGPLDEGLRHATHAVKIDTTIARYY